METAPTPLVKAVIIAGGHTSSAIIVPDGAFVVAADSGYEEALRQSIPVDLLVGDMDSISTEGLAHAEANSQVDRHPTDKDHTDLELAFIAAHEHGAHWFEVYGAEGGRLDHLIGAALAIGTLPIEAAHVVWHTTDTDVYVATEGRRVELSGTAGDLVSLVPVKDASGITTSGLSWPLADDTLVVGTSRGLSNRLKAPNAWISVRVGTLLIFHGGEQS